MALLGRFMGYICPSCQAVLPYGPTSEMFDGELGARKPDFVVCKTCVKKIVPRQRSTAWNWTAGLAYFGLIGVIAFTVSEMAAVGFGFFMAILGFPNPGIEVLEEN